MRGRTYRQLIQSNRWQRLRLRALAEHPFCEDCRAEGRLRPAEHVHHITPVEATPFPDEQQRRCFDPSNLVCLCPQCHTRRHMVMGKSGSKDSMKKRNDIHLREIISRFYE